MKLTFLGTGTSHGVPMIGCHCAVCRSNDPRDRRRRSALFVESDATAVLIDTPPDFRDQALQSGIERLDAVFFTHSHADHINGFDDLRRFGQISGAPVPVHGSADTLETIRQTFSYIFKPPVAGTTLPRVEFHPIEGPVAMDGLSVRPLKVHHGPALIDGFLLEEAGFRAAYIPDCSGVPEETAPLLQGLDVLAIDALRRTPHPTHFCLDESLAVLKAARPRLGLLTHLCHDLSHAKTEAELPDGIRIAYDGMVIDSTAA